MTSQRDKWLRPCPFCGRKPYKSKKHDQHIANVKHKISCFLSERGMDDRIYNFNVVSWNKRVTRKES